MTLNYITMIVIVISMFIILLAFIILLFRFEKFEPFEKFETSVWSKTQYDTALVSGKGQNMQLAGRLLVYRPIWASEPSNVPYYVASDQETCAQSVPLPDGTDKAFSNESWTSDLESWVSRKKCLY
jgi:hypothetical protein